MDKLIQPYSGPIRGLLFVFTVLLTFNIFLLPFDKLVLPIYLGVLLSLNGWRISRNTLLLFVAFFGYVVWTLLLNIGKSSYLIFYPVLFAFTAVILSHDGRISLRMVQQALSVNIIIGVCFALLGYVGIDTPYSLNLITKGVPFVVAPQGFLPTLQTYGTCCIAWLLIAFHQEEPVKNWRVFFVGLALCATVNRTSILFLLLLLFLYRRKVFYWISLLIVAVVVYFFDLLWFVFFSAATVDSRKELRLGATLSYWRSDDIWVYLFGRGNHQTTDLIAQKTFWGRRYIENGLDFIIHSYGMFGLGLYLALVGGLVWWLVRKRLYAIAIACGFYFTVIQYITNEFLSGSMFLFLAVVLLLAHRKTNFAKTSER